jgi:hypothetical protein
LSTPDGTMPSSTLVLSSSACTPRRYWPRARPLASQLAFHVLSVPLLRLAAVAKVQALPSSARPLPSAS